MNSTLRILDVKEKEVTAPQAPSFPQPKSATTGFPDHKKRMRLSAFKKQRQTQEDSTPPTKNVSAPFRPTGSAPSGSSTVAQPATAAPRFDSERQKIDKENRDKIAAMSSGEISQAQQELFSTLDPSIIQMLLRRANLDERPRGPNPFDEPSSSSAAAEPKSTELPKRPAEAVEEGGAPANVAGKTEQVSKKVVSFAATVEDEIPEPTPQQTGRAAVANPDDDDGDAKVAQREQQQESNTTNTTHFPTPSPLPDLDPSDPDFLSTLHAKYFPNLPADPTKLAWMAPVPTPDSPADRDSPYYPGQASLPVSQLRFDFRGRLLPPRLSRSIPTTKGLHHHGEAPEAAGYTVQELARLARSAVPAQRCIAFQTLGRILFRLGRGEWGAGEGTMGEGIFRQVSEGRALDSLREAADVEEGRGHRGSRAYAIEALWLYEKGGWKKTIKGR